MVEREWLQQRLESGASMEAIAREVGKDPSTVAYWVNKHGLVSSHAERHQSRGPVEEERLRELVERGLSVRQIAAELGRGPASVRHWLKRFGLKTEPLQYAGRANGVVRDAAMRECRTHGWVAHVRDAQGSIRCRLCRSSRVVAHRRAVKARLVAENGGACALCGYDRSVAALQFHHVDPSQKGFNISRQGRTTSLANARTEAAKCILLCANCHAEVEAGVANLPAVPADIAG